jgi:hypothetical protein
MNMLGVPKYTVNVPLHYVDVFTMEEEPERLA